MPSWAKSYKPYIGESGKEFAKRHYTGPDSEFNKIKKWGERSFE